MSSLGGNMNYIYGNTLVLGDSSYLEHHGIKNQKWGVRRFQNPDGSLTAAGRIRYGVTGAAKAAFKVGKKLGAATASAARAGMKKAQDNAYAKKKEKASQTREGVLKNKKMFTNEELKRLEERFKIEDDMRNAGLRHGQEIAKTISAYSDAAVKTMNALQTGGKAVKAISDGLSAIQDYKEKRDISKKASDAGMSTADYKEYTKAKTSEKTSNKPPNDDNPPNDGGGAGSKKQAEYTANRQKVQEAIYAKRKADLDSRESGVKQREDYLNKRQDALVKIAKQRQSEQDARESDLNRRDKAASERESKLKETAKAAADVMSKLNKRKADLDDKEAFLNSVEGYRLDTLSEFKKNEEEAEKRKKKKVKHSAIGEEMYADYLEHHGIKGQKWGVRRFQNPDGSLTDKGRKHYQKKLDREERKLTAANAARGKYERVRTPISVGMAVIGAVAGGMAGIPAGPAGIAAGAAFVSSIAGSSTYAEYTLKGVFAGHGANRSKKKIAKYKEALAQDAFEIQNGVLIYGSDQSGELEHFGLKGMKWGVRRFQNPDGTRTALGKKRDQYGATVSIRGQKSSESFGITKKQAKGKAAAEVLKNRSDLSDNERKSLQKHVDRASKETAKLNKYRERKKRAEEENAEQLKIDQLDALITGMLSLDRYKENIAAINKNHKREVEYLDKMDERDMHNEKAFTAKTVAKGMGVALAVTAGLAGITAAATGTMVISGMAAAAGGTVGAISGELKRSQYREQRRKEMGLDDSGPTKVKGYAYLRQDGFQIQNGVLIYGSDQSGELEHFGLKGMKWGVRRFQNKDGSLTEAGKQRYANTGNLDSGGGGGGGAPEEEDEETKKKIEEAAKKAGMTVDEYRKKFADKVAEIKKKTSATANFVGSASVRSAIKKASDTADVYSKYYGAKAKARKIAENSSAEQQAKYGDKRNIREQATANELNNLRAKERREAAIRSRMTRKFEKKAASARAHGNADKAEAYSRESNNQFSKAVSAYSKAETFRDARDATLTNHVVRNAKTAMKAQSATLAENRNRNAAHLAERRREKAINEAKAKIRSGKLPAHELTRYAKSSVGQLKSAAKAELARREKEHALASMGSDYARATAHVTSTSSTANTADAHNEKLARDRRDKRKQATKDSATAKKNRLAGSGRKKYVSGQTSGIGRVGSGRGKTSTRR